MISENCVINDGCIVSFNVVLAPSVVLKERSRISLYKYNPENEEFVISEESSNLGKGFLFDFSVESKFQTQKENLSNSMGGELDWIIKDSENSKDSVSESSNFEDHEFEVDKFISKESNKHSEFIEEIKALVLEMIEKEDDVDSVQIEINSLKFSQNKDFFECISGILQGIVFSCNGRLSGHFEK